MASWNPITEEERNMIIELATTKDELGRVRTHQEIADKVGRCKATVANILHEAHIAFGKKGGYVSRTIPASVLNTPVIEQEEKHEAEEFVPVTLAVYNKAVALVGAKTSNKYTIDAREKTVFCEVNELGIRLDLDKIDDLIDELKSVKKAAKSLSLVEVY